MKVEGKIIYQNDKYRILLFVPPEGSVIHFPLQLGITKVTLDIKSYAKLQKRRWFFGWSWSTIKLTNRFSVGKEWVDKYFEEEETYE